VSITVLLGWVHGDVHDMPGNLGSRTRTSQEQFGQRRAAGRITVIPLNSSPSHRPLVGGKRPQENPDQPCKNTRGRGLIVHSSVDQEMVGKAVFNLEDFFMGCIH
jgi:hypothetical protein